MKGKKVCRILAVYLGAQLLKQVDYDVPQQRLSMGLIHVIAEQRLVLACST